MLELQYEQSGHILKNVHVTRDGTRVGTELPSFIRSYSWFYITDNVDATLKLTVVGDFVLMIVDGPFNIPCGVHLCLFEEPPKQDATPESKRVRDVVTQALNEVEDIVDIWPSKHIWITPQETFGGFAKRFNNQVVFNGAIFLPINPATNCGSTYKEGDFTDKTSNGRWLFPHPDGSRAAFEHMQKTTFEDDFERLMPHFEEHPELMETFSDLI